MKIIKVLFGLSLLVNVLWAQAPPVPKKASPERQAEILKLQLKATRILASFNSCKETDFQGQYSAASLQIQQQVDEALKEAGLDKKDWDVNLETFEFVNRTPTPPATVPPKQEALKPAPAGKKP